MNSEKIIGDWMDKFSSLKRYKKTRRILKIEGPLCLGIEFEKFFSFEYRPRFIAINLLDNSYLKLVPCIDQTVRNNKNIEIIIHKDQHERTYISAAQSLKEQARVDLEKNLTIKDMLDGLVEHIDCDLRGTNPFESCKAIINISCLLDEKELKEKYLHEGISRLKTIPSKFLELQTHGFDKWLATELSRGKEILISNIKSSIERYGLKTLNIKGVDMLVVLGVLQIFFCAW